MSGLCFSSCGSVHRNESSVLSSLPEFNNTIAESEQRIVFSNTNIFTGMVNGTALTNDNVAGDCRLAAEDLYSQAFAV